ncbi:unnamed protein product, partial [Mesorhabditis belari]|uniref:Glycosyltransferase family 92 protein n=1 Tax=Mesorhabditis belari TaxID=2138241 RepID=A0AAF3FCY0_9BILA
MRHSFFLYIGAGAAVVLLLLEVRNGMRDDHYQMVAERGQSVADHAGEFIEKIRNSILSIGTDDMFGPYDMEQYKLPDGSLTGNEMFVWYAFYDLRDPEGPRIRLLANTVCKDLKKEDVVVEVNPETSLALDWIEVLGSAGCSGGGGGHCRLQETDLSTVVYRGTVPDEITVIRKGQRAKMKLHMMPDNYKDR